MTHRLICIRRVAILTLIAIYVALLTTGCGDNADAKVSGITMFSFPSINNSGLAGDVTTTIEGTTITATVPFGTDVSALRATFSTTGATVTVNGILQVSGVTANDFTNPVVFRVTAADDSSLDYTVTVMVAPNSANEITGLSFRSSDNSGLAADVTATITGTSITATVPFGTNVTGLKARFSTTGETAMVGGTVQVSGVTANDFTGPVVYHVIAADSSTTDYTVTITVAPSTANDITAFSFLSLHNFVLTANVTATITGTSITATVPFATNVTALTATFSTTGGTVTVGTTAQVSNVTSNNFTSSVTYRVTAADSSTKDYTVTVTVAASPAKDITGFSFLSVNNAGLAADVTATISGTTISATVPFGTNVAALKATFSTTAPSVTVGGTAQVSGTTLNNFTNPVIYRATAADSSTKDYMVTIVVASGAAKDLTAFSFLSVRNPGLAADVTATITGTTITATVPTGTNRTALKATFSTTGANVMVSGTTQMSGVIANDFTSPVVFRVTAADSSTQDYTVTVSAAPSTARDITAFSFLSTTNSALVADTTGLIDGTIINVAVPRGTNVTGLIATFSTSGASVTVSSMAQVSGVTGNNFTSPVIYRVTAADSSTKDYRVTVTDGGVSGVISASPMHTCAVVNGGARCWGENVFGQLGNGPSGNGAMSSVPVQAAGMTSGVQAIATSRSYTCAIVNGGLICRGTGAPNSVPWFTSGVQAIAAGHHHMCVVVNGGVQCWGSNAEGELGNNSTMSSSTPVQVVGLTSGVQAITAGYGHTCALVNGAAKCWGYNPNGQLGNGSTSFSSVPIQVAGLTSGVQAISASVEHTCAIVNGGVRCWGAGGQGRLGNNNGSGSRVPVQVFGLISGAQAISAGGIGPSGHTCAIVNGGVQCWGNNNQGQIGLPDIASLVPVPVSGLSSGVQAIAAGGFHTCASVNGSIRCWGRNVEGQLGNNSTSDSTAPVHVAGLMSGVLGMAAGANHACSIVNGGAQCWGRNTWGQLGNNSTTTSAVPVQVSGLTGVQDVSAGVAHTCALANGGVECWGRNNVGQLGNNSTTDSSVPVQVVGLTSGVQAIAVGNDYACALVDGGARCWGWNLSGQLGNNATVDSPVPVQVSGLAVDVQAIAVGVRHSCALVSGGMQCWGFNDSGQLGNNSRTESHVPIAVSGLTNNVRSVAVGAYHTCATVNGGAQCWGNTFYGQIGAGQIGGDSTTDALVPVQVSGLTSEAQAITCGAWHTCALANGGLQCWGSNEYGQLGDGSTTDRSVPVQVSGLAIDVQSVAPGGYHTCALVNGGAQCWGWNIEGALGNNSTTDSAVPVPVSAWAQ